jgi:glycosyltransferase involved in cell wall biosynthesis
MSTLYAIPTKIIHKIPVVSNMIADSSNRLKSWSLNSLFFKISMFFSDVILSNSQAGLDAYKIKTSKARYIHNGVSMKRFNQNFDIKKEREALGIKTKYIVVMVASFSDYKDYNLFINIAKDIRQIRDDITFIGIGDGCELKHIEQRVKDENINNVLLTGNLMNVESIVAASDIGLLCTFSEGISNSIIEYMALCKPVIVTDLIGGSKEIVVEGETGYIIERDSEKIISLINTLLNNEELRITMGLKGKERIVTEFSIEKMGKEFEKVYNEVLSKNRYD